MKRIGLSLFVVALLSPARPCVAQSDSEVPTVEYAIAIHGGAGKAPATDPWRKGRAKTLENALRIGQGILEGGGKSLDTVEAVIRVLEDSLYFNAGKGAVFNAVGAHELDASIMDGSNRACGAVGGVRTVRNPISLARLVMTNTRHILLATDGAERFADEMRQHGKIERVPNDYFSTEHRKQELQRVRDAISAGNSLGTVGCVALDRAGNLAAGTSTGGLVNKKFGRLGDSPIVGAGTFADNQTCAVSCTGTGEDFMRNAVAFDVSARMEYRGTSLQDAVQKVLHMPKRPVRGGIIAVGKHGEIAMQFNTQGMARAAADSRGRWEIHVAE